jgi:hypothetical protein
LTSRSELLRFINVDVFLWAVTTFFGVWTGLGVAQLISGHFMFRMFSPTGVDWSTNEIRLSGASWAVCGLVGAISVLLLNLFGSFLVGTPWVMLANPFAPAFLCTLLAQVLIEQHHRGRWPFTRRLSD